MTDKERRSVWSKLDLLGLTTEQEEIVFLLALAQAFSEEKSKVLNLMTVNNLVDELELALSNKKVRRLVESVRYGGGWDKRRGFFDTSTHEKKAVQNALEHLIPDESVAPAIGDGLFLSPSKLKECIWQSSIWAEKLIKWCRNENSLASPVFWMFDVEQARPVSKAVGSFASTALASILTQSKRYQLDIGQSEVGNKFFEEFINEYSHTHSDTHGNIVFRGLDDDYPGSHGVPYKGETLSCPTVNSDAFVLTTLCGLENSKFDEISLRLFENLISRQNSEGGWAIQALGGTTISELQVMSSALALEAICIFRACHEPVEEDDSSVEQMSLHSISSFVSFLKDLSEHVSFFGDSFRSSENVYQSIGLKGIIFGSIAGALRFEDLPANIRQDIDDMFSEWSDKLAEIWRPDWRNTISVRIPIPQWDGGFDPTEFYWALPYDAYLGIALLEYAIAVRVSLSEPLFVKVCETIQQTLAIQERGVWRDVPMALEGNDRGFPQNIQIYNRLILCYLRYLGDQINA